MEKTIEVPCDQKTAFTVFIDIGSWWPTNRFATSVMCGSSVRAIRVDARSNWEGLGYAASMAQDGYKQAWVMILEGAYRSACAEHARA